MQAVTAEGHHGGCGGRAWLRSLLLIPWLTVATVGASLLWLLCEYVWAANGKVGAFLLGVKVTGRAFSLLLRLCCDPWVETC